MQFDFLSKLRHSFFDSEPRRKSEIDNGVGAGAVSDAIATLPQLQLSPVAIRRSPSHQVSVKNEKTIIFEL